MNGFEMNKLAAAVLVALLVAMLAGFVAHKVVKPEKLEKNAYVVEGVVSAPAEGGKAAEAPKGPADIAPLMAAADVAAGQKTARVCATCHSFGKGEPNKIGPNLFGVMGAKHAHVADFSYSDAMKSSGGNWDLDELNKFIYNPRGHIPGTKMTFAGIKNDQDRANLIGYLKTLK